MANDNGNTGLTRLVWWAIGIGAIVVVGGGSFFATAYLMEMNDRVKANTAGHDLCNEQVNILEGRVSTLENTASASLAAITRSLEKMETWQEQVRQDIADLKAASKRP